MSDLLLTHRPLDDRLDTLTRALVVESCRGLRAAREWVGLSQARVAALAEIGISHLSELESGRVDPQLPTYLAVRNAVTGAPEQGRRAALRQAGDWAAQVGVARRERRICKSDFCVVGIAPRQVARVEDGEHVPLLSTALRISEVVKVDV